MTDTTLAAQIEALALYKLVGEAIDYAWNRSNACTAQSLPPIDLADNERVFLGKAAVDAVLPAIVTALRQAEGRCTASPDHADILETIENAADDWQKNGYTSALAEVRDMANVGRSLMEALPKGYCYMNSPAEIVVDLQNERDEALALRQAEAAPGVVEALEPDAYGNEGDRSDCLSCGGRGIDYGETCVGCGGLGWVREALARQHGAREGMVMVPREPTEAMLDTMHATIRILVDPREKTADVQNDREVWSAMIAASPAPSPAPDERDDKTEILRTVRINFTDEQIAYLNAKISGRDKAKSKTPDLYAVERAIAAVLCDGLDGHRSSLEKAHDTLNSAIGWPGLSAAPDERDDEVRRLREALGNLHQAESLCRYVVLHGAMSHTDEQVWTGLREAGDAARAALSTDKGVGE